MLPYLALGTVLVLLAVWAMRRHAIRVSCDLELERTHEHLHAHVVLHGVAPEPGDAVLVQGAPSRLEWGEKRTMRAHATVLRAGPVRRWWTRVWGIREFYELYDVGFEG